MHLQLYVMKGAGPTLLGREWLHSIRLNWPLMHLEKQSGFRDVLDRHAAVFSDKLGRLLNIKARIPTERRAETTILESPTCRICTKASS